MSFDYSEFKKLRDKYAKAADEEWDKFLAEFLLEMGLEALTRTKDNTPVDTGLARNMWQLGDSHNVIRYVKGENQRYQGDVSRSKAPTIKSVKRSGGDLIIEIYNNVEYISHIEDGHKLRGGKGKYQGIHMARNAIALVEKRIPAEFEKRFKTWVENLEEI